MRFALALILALISSAAGAQSVQQSGFVTPGHPTGWVTNGVIGDGGTAAQGNLTGVGVTASGPAICQNSGAISGPYNQLCLGDTQTGGGVISLNNYNGATGGISFSIDGVTQIFPVIITPTIANNPSCFTDITGAQSDCSVTGTGSVALAGSPAFTGVPTAPTAPGGTNTTQLATTAFVQSTVSSSVTSLGNYSADSTLTITGTGSGPWTGAVTIKCTVATSSQIGCVEPDGTIITDVAGAITVAKATTSAFGVVEVGAGGTIAVSGGVITCATATSSQLGCSSPDNVTLKASTGVYAAQYPTSGNLMLSAGNGAVPTAYAGASCSSQFVTATSAAGAVTCYSLGTGVYTALGVNVGTAGAFVVNGGALGTPSSGTLTNGTGLPVSTGISGLGTGIATALAVNVGTAGAFVVNGGALGTPSSGTLTNGTGLPVSTGISGLGTGIATALAVNVGTAGAPVINGGVLGTPSSGTAGSGFTVQASNVTWTGTIPGAYMAAVNLAASGNGGVSGTAPIGNGGTGQITASAAFGALSPLTTEGDFLYYHSSANVRLGVGSNYNVMVSNGTDPVWGQVNLVNGVTGTLALGNGGTSQATAAAARGSSGLNIDELTSHGDSNYVIAATDRGVYHTALSAARTDTLPAANSVNAGQRLYIVDFAGVANSTDTITLQRAGSDTVNGSTSAVAINSQYGWSVWMSDGSSRWTYQQGGSGGGSGTVTSATIVAAGGLTSSGTCTITTSGTCTIYAPGGYLNKFRNGTFDVWQRGTGATSIGTSGNYFADGWKVYFTGSSSVTAEQAAGPYTGGPLYSLEIEGATSNTDIKAGQRIESYVAAPLAGQTVTVQFWYYQSTGSTVTPKFSTCYASAQDNFGTCTGDVSSTGLTACATATWCQEAYTFTASSSAGNGYEIDLDCNAGFTSISVNCRFAAADIRVTPGVSTGVNANPPPPELRPIAAELAFCQRYYQASYFHFNALNNTDAVESFYSFGITMRLTPTFTYTDTVANASRLSTGGPLNNVTVSGSPIVTANYWYFDNSTGSNSLNWWAGYFYATAEL